MSEPPNPIPPSLEAAEPKADGTGLPVWLVVSFLGLACWAAGSFAQQGGRFHPQVYLPYHSVAEVELYQPPSGGGNLERGKAVYENVCALCHNVDGTGKPNQAPPFVGSEWVLGSYSRMIRIPLSGLSGAVSVKGEVWNLAMPAMGAALSDEDLAAVLTYIRQSWGNKASAVTADQVKAVRAETGNRSQPWTASELDALP